MLYGTKFEPLRSKMFKEMKLKQGYQSKINVHTRNNRIRSKWIPQKLGEPQTDDKIKV